MEARNQAQSQLESEAQNYEEEKKIDPVLY